MDDIREEISQRRLWNNSMMLSKMSEHSPAARGFIAVMVKINKDIIAELETLVYS